MLSNDNTGIASQKQHRRVNFRIFSSDKYKQQAIYTRGIMASTIQADVGGGVNVTATTTANGIQYTINLANGSSSGPYTGDQLVNVGSGLQTAPPPSTFRLTYNGQTVATSTDPNDIENGPDIVPNLFQVQKYAEQNLTVAPNTNTADAPASTTEPTTTPQPVDAPEDTTDPNVSSDAATNDTTNPQYTGNSTSPYGSGITATSTIDSATSTQTVTITAPNGATASVTVPANYTKITSAQESQIYSQLAAQGYRQTIAYTNDVFDTASAAMRKAQDQQSSATAASSVSGNPPPALSQPTPVDPTEDPQLQQQQADAQSQAADAAIQSQTRSVAPSSQGSSIGLQGATATAQQSANAQDAANTAALKDWRVCIALSPDANYLYKANPAGILAPLAATDGVIFPYTPAISVSYAASYDVATIIHSNYKVYQYAGSSVDQVTITGDFTAQDTFEANYLLATIHFFRSMTKMFYGQDQNPKPGTPPPVAFLYGYGAFQFQGQPLAITGFTYNLPQDVDYIQAQSTSALAGQQAQNILRGTTQNGRLGTQINPGGTKPKPGFTQQGAPRTPTYVPTKIQLSITCVPLVSRNQVSNQFSLTDYATGQLLQPGERGVGGFW